MGNKVLFLQTSDTSKYQYGLLQKNETAIEIDEIHEIDKTENLFIRLENLLKKRNLNLQTDIKEMLVCAGPGSYTGMRVGEGISTIAELVGVKILNYYHYEIPASLEYSSGIWVCRAFKGEYFVHEWSKEHGHCNYIADQQKIELLLQANEKTIFYFGETPKLDEKFKNCIMMKNEMIQKPQCLTLLYKNATRKQLMYFRSPENEFKVNQ